MTIVRDSAAEVTVEELTPEQGAQLFEDTCQKYLGVSVDTFLDHYDNDSIPSDWSPRDVQHVEFLLPFIR